VGWNQARQAARFHEVWVLTRSNNRQAIEEELARVPLRHAHWVYYDLPRWLSFWKKGQRGVRLYYYLWQVGAYRRCRQLQKKVRFDLVHHVSFVNYWTPSMVALLPVRFLWGPVGGGESAPRSFWATFSWRGKIFELLRAAARWRGENDPLVRLIARRAKLALATTPETARRLARLGCASVRVLGESALNEGEVERLVALPGSAGEILRLLSVGRLLQWKGYHLSLEAFARMRQSFPEATYWLIGDGPERQHLEKQAERLCLGDSVRFLGWLPRDQVLRLLVAGDLLVHPSLHDSGGWTCLEAMAAGCPVVCLDTGGPATQVSEESGIRIPLTGPRLVVEQMAEALVRLGSDRRLRIRMGEAARRRVREFFNWDRKGELLREIYLRVMNGAERLS
jgi:glycosyltransferase involved in cell wall biosynthesis